jgi:hypothetical protein
MTDSQEAKQKRALISFFDDYIVIECPHCGMRLLKTDYQKISLLFDRPTVPGKICDTCKGVALLKLSKAEREKAQAHIQKNSG